LNNILPDCLSELLKKGVYLESIFGVKEYAWTYELAKEVLKRLTGNGFIIDGGDVLKKNKGELEYTIPNWHYDLNNDLKKDENIRLSYEKAINTLDWYHNKFGDEFLYVIVYKILK
jgi:hypothetical protein